MHILTDELICGSECNLEQKIEHVSFCPLINSYTDKCKLKVK